MRFYYYPSVRLLQRIQYLAHLILIFAKYYDVPLKAKHRWSGSSKAFLQDDAAELDRALFYKDLREKNYSGRDNSSFDHGVRLLLGNVAQMFNAAGRGELYSKTGLLENCEWLTVKEIYGG